MIKNFSWRYFIIFFLISVAVCYLRFYVGFALILSFVISWFLSLKKPMKEKFWLGFTLSFILTCFTPYFAEQGYFGSKVFDEFLNSVKITQYREISYNPSVRLEEIKSVIPAKTPTKTPTETPVKIPAETLKTALNGTGSSFLIETGFKLGPIKFIRNSLISFTYSLLGPFVWQLRSAHQFVSLVEVIPWYLYIISFLYLLAGFVKRERLIGLWNYIRKTAPLWTFALFALGALSLFINNYGIIARIRIPMFICLVIMMSLLFNKKYLTWKNT